MEEQIVIKRGDNGIIVEIYEDDINEETPTICKRVLVFEEKGKDRNYDYILDSMYEIMEFLGVCNSKHSKRNIVFGYERGWDYLGSKEENIVEDSRYSELIRKEDIENS